MRGKFFDLLTQQAAWLGVCILCWLLVLTLAFPAQAQPTPTASSTDDLRRMQEQIDQQRSNLIKQRDRLSTIEQATQENISGIQRGIQSTEAAYKDYESQIQKANQHLKALQVELAKSEQAYSQQQASTIARLRFLQRQQMAGLGWYVLLRSQNLNELLDRRHQVKLVYQADQKILNSLKAESERINKQKIEIEGQKNYIALLNQQLLAQRTQYQAQLVAQQELIKRLNTDKQALEAAQAQLAVDSRNIGILIRREIAASNKARFPNTGSFSTGQFIYPSDAEITSNFGWRIHPILGYSRFHAGIDFGASYGSMIRAADSGTVIFAGWYGGYGYAVIVDHSNGIATLYAHSSEIYVAQGQTVQIGDAIAAVGSTGLSTGPHLHFEVRKDGEPIDPMAYLEGQ